jgi:hypothetical protein
VVLARHDGKLWTRSGDVASQPKCRAGATSNGSPRQLFPVIRADSLLTLSPYSPVQKPLFGCGDGIDACPNPITIVVLASAC